MSENILTNFDPFSDNNDDNNDCSDITDFDADDEKSKKIVKEDEDTIKDIFNEKEIPEYTLMHRYALHSTFLALSEARKSMENGQDKISVNNFKIIKEIFDKDICELKKIQVLEQKMYDSLSNNIVNIIKTSIKEIYDEILKKYNISQNDEVLYLQKSADLTKSILKETKDNILNKKFLKKAKKDTEEKNKGEQRSN